MGRIGDKGGNIRFQLNLGPSTDANCIHCGSRQFVFPFLSHGVTVDCWADVGRSSA